VSVGDAGGDVARPPMASGFSLSRDAARRLLLGLVSCQNELDPTTLRIWQGHRSTIAMQGCIGIRLGTQDLQTNGGCFCTIIYRIRMHIKARSYSKKAMGHRSWRIHALESEPARGVAQMIKVLFCTMVSRIQIHVKAGSYLKR
jgi:hypothetical protein